MKFLKDDFKDKFLKSPEARTLNFTLSVIVSGLLCSALITEISTPTGLNWSTCLSKSTFWAIVIYSLIIYIYNRYLYIHDRKVERFLQENYLRAYIIQSCLPEALELAKSHIREGNKKEFIDLVDVIKSI